MIETLKSIILDFQEVELETGVPRRLKIKAVPGKAAAVSEYLQWFEDAYFLFTVKIAYYESPNESFRAGKRHNRCGYVRFAIVAPLTQGFWPLHPPGYGPRIRRFGNIPFPCSLVMTP